MPFDVQFISTMRTLESTVFGTGGRTVGYRVNTVKVTGATRQQGQTYTLSAGLSNQEIQLSPIAASQPGGVLFIEADNPIDVRLNASGASMISGVRHMMIAASVSALFVTAGSIDTVFRAEVVGGGTVTASSPLP